MPEPHPQVINPQHPLVIQLCKICMGYPEAVEVEAWGRPTFRAGKRVFVCVGSSMDSEHSIVFQPDLDDLLGIDINRPGTDWTELAELIDDSDRQAALRGQHRQLDGSAA